ncbi:MAG: putative Ig domain-containing protein [Actinomycetota bacterium]
MLILPRAAGRSFVVLAALLAAVAIAVAIAAFAGPARAQADTPVVIETLDPEPEVSDGVIGFTQSSAASQNWRVRGFAQIGDVMYVAGAFTQVRETNGTVHDQPYLAAFDVDTGDWIPSFQPTIDDVVWDLAATDDGRLLVGGEFDTVNGVARTGIVLLDTNGDIDPTFVTTVDNVGSTFESTVRTVAVDGSTIYLGGDFNRIVDDQFAHGAFRVGRVNLSNGRLQGAWRPVIQGGGVFDLAPDPSSGVVHIVGTFLSVDGAADTRAAAAVSIVDASVMPFSQFAFNNMGANNQYGVGVLDDNVWIGGTQHMLQRIDADTYNRQGFYITSGQPGTIDPVIGNYTSTGTGGDYQFVAVVDGQIVAGCHCRAGHHSSEIPEDINVANRPVHAYRTDGERIDWFPSLYSWNEGPYGAAGDTNGCLWLGGDFTGNVDGFSRHCPLDGTTAEITRPFSSVVGDDQAVEIRARVTDPAAANTIELRVRDAGGQYLQANGTFTGNANPLPATITGAGTRAVEARYQLPVLPAGDYQIEVNGSGASGSDSTNAGLRVAALDDFVVGTGQPSNNSWDVFDTNAGRWVRGQLNDPAMFGPQGFVPVNSTTLLDHETNLSASDLVGVDLMWMPPTSGNQYSSSELNVLENWVSDGGVMVAYATSTGNDTVLDRFGLPLVGSSLGGSMTAVAANSDHPILDGVYGPVSLTGFSGRQFDPADVPGNWLTLFRNSAGQPTVVLGPYGDGYVVALSTRSVLQSQTGVALLGNLLSHVTDVALGLSDVTSIPPIADPVGPQTSPAFQPVQLQIPSSDPDGGNVGFSAVGLPAGLSINASSGLISGTPTTAVVAAPVVVTVQDDEGDTIDVAFTWTIEEAVLVAPDNIVVTTNGVDEVTLSWDPVPGVSGYLIHRDFVFLQWVPAGTLSFTDTTVVQGETYRYQLRSQVSNGDFSSPSPIQSITVFDDGGLPPFGTPPDVVVDTNGVDEVSIQWGQVEDATGYLIHRDFVFLKWVPFTESSWVDDTVVQGETYRYQVRAQAADGSFSAPSPIARITVDDGTPDITPPQTPPNAAAVVQGGDVVITWDEATDDVGVTGYLVHRDFVFFAYVAGGDVTSFTDDTVVAGTQYRYQVRSQDAAGNVSPPTDILRVTP